MSAVRNKLLAKALRRSTRENNAAQTKRGRPSQEVAVSSFRNGSAVVLLVFKLVVLLILVLVLLFVFELIVLLILILVLALVFLIIHLDSPLSPIV